MSFVSACAGTPPVTGDAGVDAGLTCGAGRTACGAACVDLKLDDEHCGRCDLGCPADQACAGGECFPRSCPDVDCSANYACLAQRCGERACVGVRCATDETCFEGVCQDSACNGVPCPAGAVCRAGSCLDISCVGVLCPSPSRCESGTCTVACVAGVECPLSNPCQRGVTDCSTGVTQCVSAGAVDAGTVCPTGLCSGGQCTAPDAGVVDAGVRVPPTVYYASTNVFAATFPGPVFTRTTLDLGPPAAGRVIAVFAGVRTNAGSYLTAVSIGGVAATRQAQAPNHVYNTIGLWTAVVPTGTANQTLTLTLSGPPSVVAASVYSLYGVRGPTAFATAGDSVDPCVASLDIPVNGLVLAGAYHNNNTAGTTWTGPTEDYDGNPEARGHYCSFAHAIVPAGATGYTVTADFSAANDDAMVTASFEGL